jgi:transcription elongation factor Elf1
MKESYMSHEVQSSSLPSPRAGNLNAEYDQKIKVVNQRFLCEFCNKDYSTRTKARTHVASHMGQATCHICNKTLSNIVNLRPHLVTHVGKLKCNICHQFFALSSLKKHAKFVHNLNPRRRQDYLDDDSLKLIDNIFSINHSPHVSNEQFVISLDSDSD